MSLAHFLSLIAVLATNDVVCNIRSCGEKRYRNMLIRAAILLEILTYKQNQRRKASALSYAKLGDMKRRFGS